MIIEAWGGPHDGAELLLPGNPDIVRFPVATPTMAYLFDGDPLTINVVTYTIERLPDGRCVVIAPEWFPRNSGIEAT